ncbi:MAG: hypothetical protein FWC66_06495 [Oscillospiraceae bacterium]|nr:hypothetical protein [Oscillospiraceae bacterium]
MMRKLRWVVFIIAGLVLLGACASDDTDPQIAAMRTDGLTDTDGFAEEPGFRSPEAAVIAYLQGLRDSDLSRMAEALPDDPVGGSLTADDIGDFVAHLNWLLEDFQSPLNPYAFNSLELLGFIAPEVLNERYASEENQDILSAKAELMGAQQLVSLVALFELGAEHYILIVNVANFEGDWRITQFSGNLGALLSLPPNMHGLIPPEFVDDFLGAFDLDSVLILV